LGLPELTIKNRAGVESLERPVAPMFAQSLALGTRISAQCYQGGTLDQEICQVNVTEGAGGEGLRGVLRTYRFQLFRGEISQKSIEVFGAL